MAHWSGIGIPETNAMALEAGYTHTHTHMLHYNANLAQIPVLQAARKIAAKSVNYFRLLQFKYLAHQNSTLTGYKLPTFEPRAEGEPG